MQMDEIPQLAGFEAMVQRAADDAVAHYAAFEHAEKVKLERMWAKLDLCLFLPLTVVVIAVIVYFRLTIGAEAGTLATPAGYAVMRLVKRL